jgi:hypothetical protein
MAVVSAHPFTLSPHLRGIYNSRTLTSGVVTTQASESPITQIHESDVTGFSTATGELTEAVGPLNEVLETTLPLFLPYDTLKDAVAAAAGFEAGNKGKGSSEIAMAFETPGSARIAWIGNRKKHFYAFTKSNGGRQSVPSSLNDVVDRMLGGDKSYSLSDLSYNVVHSVASIQYSTADVSAVAPTRVKIPKWVRPIVCTDAAPAATVSGVTVYPPGKFIVIFGFVTIKARNDVPQLTAPASGWAFWLKVLIKVVTYAIELATVAGLGESIDDSPAIWATPSNLGQVSIADMEAQISRANEFSARAKLAYQSLLSPIRAPLPKRRKNNKVK